MAVMENPILGQLSVYQYKVENPIWGNFFNVIEYKHIDEYFSREPSFSLEFSWKPSFEVKIQENAIDRWKTKINKTIVNSGVYFIAPKNKVSPIKIGFSTNIKKRLSNLQTRSLCGKLEVFKYFSCNNIIECRYIERIFHNRFRKQRLVNGLTELGRTEWFNISITDVCDLIEDDDITMKIDQTLENLKNNLFLW